MIIGATDLHRASSVFLAWFMHSLIPEVIRKHLLFSWPGLGVADTPANRMDKVLVLVSLACPLGKWMTDRWQLEDKYADLSDELALWQHREGQGYLLDGMVREGLTEQLTGAYAPGRGPFHAERRPVERSPGGHVGAQCVWKSWVMGKRGGRSLGSGCGRLTGWMALEFPELSPRVCEFHLCPLHHAGGRERRGLRPTSMDNQNTDNLDSWSQHCNFKENGYIIFLNVI